MTARLEREQSVDGQDMNEMSADIMGGLHGMIAWMGGLLGGLLGTEYLGRLCLWGARSLLLAEYR